METQEFVLDKLQDIIKGAGLIADEEPLLGQTLLIAIKMSMDLYEHKTNGKEYLLNDIVEFLADVQGLSVSQLLDLSFMPKNDAMVDFIMGNNSDGIEGYREATAKLLKAFRATVNECRRSE